MIWEHVSKLELEDITGAASEHVPAVKRSDGEAAYQSVGNLFCFLDHRWGECGGSVAPLAFGLAPCLRLAPGVARARGNGSRMLAPVAAEP